MRKGSTNNKKLLLAALLSLLGGAGMMNVRPAEAQRVPQVPGAPRVVAAPTLTVPHLLDWPLDKGRAVTPNLNDEAADRLYDLHGAISSCDHMDLVLSTEGNYHMALRTMFFRVFLPRYGSLVRNWYYTTSPPVSVLQIAHHDLAFGNLKLQCRPEIAVASMRVMHKLEAMKVTQGSPVAIIRGRGNVLLVKHGNPKNIRSIWSLRRPNVHLVTPNPYLEPGAFLNYAGTIYEVAKHDPHPPHGWTANRLFNSIFGPNAPKGKWLIGDRIHHRDEPQAVAYGGADVAVLMYQLAKYTVKCFPHTFSMIPLGGTVNDPRPLPGNQVGETYMVRIRGQWTPSQRAASNDLWAMYKSAAFTKILKEDGLLRPAGWR